MLNFMKKAVVFIVLSTLLLLPVQSVCGSDHLEYNVHVKTDGSALWKIIQATDIDAATESWEEFEDRIFFTVKAASNSTGRDMAVDLTSLEMKTEILWEASSKTIKYSFCWQNFSLTEEGQISFGDVFSAGFFSLLYGDGELYVVYPAEYDLKSISSPPNERDDSTQTLHWYRSQDFLSGEPRVLLASRDAGSNENSSLLTAALLGLAALSTVAIGLFIFKQRRKGEEKLSGLDEFSYWQKAQSDQEKILQLLRSSGGSLKQSVVCDKLRFSKAKTSQLLTKMEKNRLVMRRKKGKNKIVFLIENRGG